MRVTVVGGRPVFIYGRPEEDEDEPDEDEPDEDESPSTKSAVLHLAIRLSHLRVLF